VAALISFYRRATKQWDQISTDVTAALFPATRL
jgi:hypothetical protein